MKQLSLFNDAEYKSDYLQLIKAIKTAYKNNKIEYEIYENDQITMIPNWKDMVNDIEESSKVSHRKFFKIKNSKIIESSSDIYDLITLDDYQTIKNFK